MTQGIESCCDPVGVPFCLSHACSSSATLYILQLDLQPTPDNCSSLVTIMAALSEQKVAHMCSNPPVFLPKSFPAPYRPPCRVSSSAIPPAKLPARHPHALHQFKIKFVTRKAVSVFRFQPPAITSLYVNN